MSDLVSPAALYSDQTVNIGWGGWALCWISVMNTCNREVLYTVGLRPLTFHKQLAPCLNLLYAELGLLSFNIHWEQRRRYINCNGSNKLIRNYVKPSKENSEMKHVSSRDLKPIVKYLRWGQMPPHTSLLTVSMTALTKQNIEPGFLVSTSDTNSLLKSNLL